MALQISGNTGTVAEVDSNTLAVRTTIRPIDVGSLGAYAVAVETGTMAAALGANSPIFSMRWTSANVALVRRIGITMAIATGFAQGVGKFDLFFARSYSATDTGGTGLAISGNNQKRRTAFATSLMADVRISTTATLTAGTRTLDAQPCASFVFNPGTAANSTPFQSYNLWRPDPTGDWPIVLAANEGLVIQATVPATGTWTADVTVEWTELASY
jgi:hypothetical protein